MENSQNKLKLFEDQFTNGLKKREESLGEQLNSWKAAFDCKKEVSCPIKSDN